VSRRQAKDARVQSAGVSTIRGEGHWGGSGRATRRTKNHDEEVARLQLEGLGVKLTKRSDDQADDIGVPVDGPYKSDQYRSIERTPLSEHRVL